MSASADSDEARPDEARPDEARPDEARPDVHPPDEVTTIVADGAREGADAGAAAEQWAAFGVRDDTVAGWKALGFGPFEAAMAQGDGYGPESARHFGRTLQGLARTWRRMGLASAEGLRWHRAGFEAKEAARLQDHGVPLERAIAAGRGHRLAG